MQEPQADSAKERYGGLGKLFRWYYLVALILVLVLLALAQALYTSGPLGAGSLLGTITDVAGRPLPDITVKLSAVGEPQETLTNLHGQFTFGGLEPGNYRIEAWGRGYPLELYEPVVIRQARPTNIQLQLRLAVREHSEPDRTSSPGAQPGGDADRP